MQKQGWFGIIIGLLILFLSNVSLAQSSNSSRDTFNVDLANKTFDEITIKLSIQDVRVNDLKQAVATLEDLQKAAKACVNNANEQINLSNETLKSFQRIRQGQVRKTELTSEFTWFHCANAKVRFPDLTPWSLVHGRKHSFWSKYEVKK